MLYPLFFKPIVKPKIWGREEWNVSSLFDDASMIVNGFLQNNSLSEIVEVYLDEILGQHVFDKFGTFFPLLCKIIDAQDNLSVQVHPDDAFALKVGLDYGKTEMWYVISDNDQASVIAGWEKNQTPASVLASLKDKTLMDYLKKTTVRRDDVVFIPAGMVHSLQKQTRVIEIQENSDITYRLYDYDRLDVSGKPRSLHIDQSLACANLRANPSPLVQYDREVADSLLISDTHFVVRRLQCKEPILRDYSEYDSFVIIIGVEGEFSIHYKEKYIVRPLSHVLIPACLEEITILPDSPQITFLEVHVP